MSEFLLQRRDTVVVKGIEVTGDPVFLKYKSRFEQLDEIEFQNFWRVYFLSIINTQLIEHRNYASRMAVAKSEERAYRKLARENGFPLGQSLLTADGPKPNRVASMPRSAPGLSWRAKLDERSPKLPRPATS